MNIYIVRGDTCQPWDYQAYGAFSSFNSALNRAAEMIKKLKNDGVDLDDDWTGLLIESFTVDSSEVPNGCGDSYYSACKDSYEVTLHELIERKLI